MTAAYAPRIVDSQVLARLESAGAVVIEGPKASGKTATARQHAKSEVLLDVDINARRAAALDPSLILEGPTPRLLDEWQTVPEIWNHVRRAIDDRRLAGQFILTGSAVAADDATRHTGAGRISRLRMRPMSLKETGDSTAETSLGDLLSGNPAVSGESAHGVRDLIDLVIRGGWPAIIGATQANAARYVRDYLEEIRRTDIRGIDGVRRDPDRVERLLRSLARNIATEVSAATLAADTGGAEGPLDAHTVQDYLNALGRLFIVEDQPAWSARLRSRDQLRKAPKRHLVDPSLAVAALGADSHRLISDLSLFGFLFESLVIRDLRVYAEASDGIVRHYRDNKGLEIDAIVETRAGTWAAFQVKLGGDDLIEQGAANLLRLRSKVDAATIGQPTSLVVVTGGGFAYVRADGVAVIPVGVIGP